MRPSLLRLAASLLVCGLVSATASGQRFAHRFEGSHAFERQGWSVASGFDMNGDAVDDLIIGSPLHNLSKADQGKILIYDGATYLLLTSRVGDSAGDQFGTAVALVNDLDGDGTGEYCVGAPYWNGGKGYVAMFSGKTNNMLWIIYGATGAQMGFSVAAAGDIDHDGKVDVVVGAPGIDTAYVFGWGTGAIFTKTGQTDSDFGYRVAGNVDVDGDGTMDFMVSQPRYTTDVPRKLECGRINAYSGATGLQIFSALGDDENDQLGLSLCGVGDVDGDGKSEVAAGTPYDDDHGNDSGLARVYNSNGSIRYDKHGATGGWQFGFSMCGIPDMTRDGRADIAIGAIGASFGVTYLVNGTDGAPLFTIEPKDRSYQTFGSSMAVGDFNHDESWDLVIGDPSFNFGGKTAAGAADVYLAAPAYWESYGQGWPGTNGNVPVLEALSDPGLGQSLTLFLSNSRGSDTTALLFIGFQQANLPTTKGGSLLVIPVFTFAFSVPASGLHLPGAIPDDLGLLLQEVDLQALEVDPGASHDLSFTRGLMLSLGIDYP